MGLGKRATAKGGCRLFCCWYDRSDADVRPRAFEALDKSLKEANLYLPVKRFLESQNFEVKGEVHDCDVLAVRGCEDPVVVELKLSLNLNVVMQAVERLALTPKVYVGIPAGNAILKARRRQILKLLRMLGLGLLLVDPRLEAGGVDVLLDPGEYRPRRSKKRRERLLGEFVQRVGDPNQGGADRRRGLMTAYRQRALRIARLLEGNGPTKASRVAEKLREPKARDILYKNVYGWFDRASLGIYELSLQGKREISLWSSITEDGNREMDQTQEGVDEHPDRSRSTTQRETSASE